MENTTIASYLGLPAQASIPLPALVDDWVGGQCRARGISFRDLTVEALEFLRASLGEGCASRTSVDADLVTWIEAEVAAYGTGLEDRVTDAICCLCAEHTGADLVTMHDTGWRRVLPSPPDKAQAFASLPASGVQRFDAVRQMRNRTDPIYDLARERSRIMAAAWRAAGSPARVTRIHTPTGPRYVRYIGRVTGARGDDEYVSEEYRKAWVAWVRQRERLRRALRDVDEASVAAPTGTIRSHAP